MNEIIRQNVNKMSGVSQKLTGEIASLKARKQNLANTLNMLKVKVSFGN